VDLLQNWLDIDRDRDTAGYQRYRVRYRQDRGQTINRSHAHDSRTNHSHEQRASNGATTLRIEVKYRRDIP